MTLFVRAQPTFKSSCQETIRQFLVAKIENMVVIFSHCIPNFDSSRHYAVSSLATTIACWPHGCN